MYIFCSEYSQCSTRYPKKKNRHVCAKRFNKVFHQKHSVNFDEMKKQLKVAFYFICLNNKYRIIK